MKKQKFMMLFLITLCGLSLQAQNFQTSAGIKSTIIVEGTSNIHDWEIKAESFIFKSDIENLQTGLVVKSLHLDLEAESLKSGKSGMDKNTYKALATDKHKRIVFVSTEVLSIKPAILGTYQVIVRGVLEIAGTKKKIDLSFDLTPLEGSYSLKGSHKIYMPDYGVTPPTAMLGSIKTGADLKIIFDLQLN